MQLVRMLQRFSLSEAPPYAKEYKPKHMWVSVLYDPSD